MAGLLLKKPTKAGVQLLRVSTPMSATAAAEARRERWVKQRRDMLKICRLSRELNYLLQ